MILKSNEYKRFMSQKKESNMDERICPYCGQSSKTVFVHGHEQCVVCKTNVEPCCQGQVLKGGRDE